MYYKNRKSQEELDAMKCELELKHAEYKDANDRWYRKMKSGEDSSKEYNEYKRLEKEYNELKYWFTIESAEQLYLNFHVGTDCYPYEVVERNEKHCFVRKMQWKPAKNAEPYSNDWDIFPCETNPLERVNLTKRGWHFPNTYGWTQFQTEPHYYYDYSF